MTKYPIYHDNDCIVQYDEHVFVWLDETGNAAGVAPFLEAARIGLEQYALFLRLGPDWVNAVEEAK